MYAAFHRDKRRPSLESDRRVDDGWPKAEARGEPLERVFDIFNEDTRHPVENPVPKVLQHGQVVGLANHMSLRARDGTEALMLSQVHSSLDRAQGGLGISLALAKGLVELHGGIIEARSAALGKGSEFVVRLPRRMTGASRRPANRLVATGKATRRRILIADENRDAAEAWRFCSDSRGMRSQGRMTAARRLRPSIRYYRRSPCSTSACPNSTAMKSRGKFGNGAAAPTARGCTARRRRPAYSTGSGDSSSTRR